MVETKIKIEREIIFVDKGVSTESCLTSNGGIFSQQFTESLAKICWSQQVMEVRATLG